MKELKIVEEENFQERGAQSEILSHLGEGIHLTSVETGKILYCNQQFEKMCGYEPGELIGKHISIVNAPSEDSPEKLAETIIDELLRTGVWSGEIRNIKKDGTKFWCYANVVTYEHPRFGKAWLSTHIDITERKLLSDALYFVNQKSGLRPGEEYFQDLAIYLGKALHMDYVFIDELSDEKTAKTLAVYWQGEVIQNIEYALQDTPCGNVTLGNLCCYPDQVQLLFPKDELLVPMKAQSYTGIPLWNARGETIGLIAVIGKAPLENQEIVKDLLQIVSIRAAAEIEHLQTQKKLRESKEKYRAIANYTYNWEAWMDPENRLLWVNPAVARVTGYTVEECFQMDDYPFPFIYTEDAPVVASYIEQAMNEKSGNDLEFRIRHKNGEIRWMALSWQPIYGAGGKYLGHRSSIRDITEREIMRQELQKSHDTLMTVLESLDAQVYVTDMETHRILFINRKLRSELGDVVGKTCWKVMRSSASGPCDDCTIPILEGKENPGKVYVWERFNRLQEQWYQVRDRAIEWVDGRKVRLEIATDITKLKEVETQYETLSYIDHLTGVGNRRSFEKMYLNEWGRCRRNKRPISLIMLDIDYFKLYNDTYGHLEGDAALRRIARVINNALNRPGDIVSRYGGEEFIISLPETKKEGAIVLAEKLRKLVEDEKIAHEVSSASPYVTISLGVSSMVPAEGIDPVELVDQADQALYDAKKRGRNRVETA